MINMKIINLGYIRSVKNFLMEFFVLDLPNILIKCLLLNKFYGTVRKINPKSKIGRIRNKIKIILSFYEHLHIILFTLIPSFIILTEMKNMVKLYFF